MNRTPITLLVIGICLSFSCRPQASPKPAPVAPALTAPAPKLLTERGLDRTGFQESAAFHPDYDLQSDFVMAYGVGGDLPERVKQWKQAGYRVHLMTGIAWGTYPDYFNGEFDGSKHADEGQVKSDGKPWNHGTHSPYMVPTLAFANYLIAKINQAVDAGVEAVFLEEPEFFTDTGYSEAFKREYENYYHQPWVRPDSSPEAQWQASKVKYYLYRRALQQVCAGIKDYARAKYGKTLPCYVATHSLASYVNSHIVSPESCLADVPEINGYIAQIWTGTSRFPNFYQGVRKERTLEAGFLEYGIMQELSRGTSRRIWYLHDPVEDNSGYDWQDYRKNYICTLTGSLLHPGIVDFEIAPWPRRIFQGKFPRRSPDAQAIPADYATTLGVVFNQLRDMQRETYRQAPVTSGLGVIYGDSAMFQRADTWKTPGMIPDANDITRQTKLEAEHMSGFYGLALPPLKHGIPIQPVQMDNISRYGGEYLRDYNVLLLSYEFQKPLTPVLHNLLRDWVSRGGSLIYVGAETDPFHQVPEWWNQSPHAYATPTQHLMELLGLERDARAGHYRLGRGNIYLCRKHPAYFSRSREKVEELMGLVRTALKAAGAPCREQNYLELRRGPYVVAACMDESVSAEPLRLTGKYVDLLEANLAVRDEIAVPPGTQAFLLDLAKVSPAPLVLASTGRITSQEIAPNRLTYQTSVFAHVRNITRVLLPAAPRAVKLEGETIPHAWHASSRTVSFSFPGTGKSVQVELTW